MTIDIKIEESDSSLLCMEFLDTLFRPTFAEDGSKHVPTEAEETDRLIALMSRVYGKAGLRLSQHLMKIGKLRSGAARAMIHGFILRRYETAEYAMLRLKTKVVTGTTIFIFEPSALDDFIERVITEESAQNKEKTLIAVMPLELMPKEFKFNKVRGSKEEKKVKPLRQQKTRTQSQIDTALTGSEWEGAIVAADAEFIPPGFTRLQVLIANGVKDYNLSNSLANILNKAGVEQIFIKKGYYREDLLLACAQALREPARSGLITAIKSESQALLEAGQD